MFSTPSTALCKATASEIFPSEYADSRFELLDTLGRGAFSAVFKATDAKAGHEVAIKAVQLPEDEQTKRALAYEVDILKQLNHPSIVKLYENISCMDGVLHLVMELLPGTTMRNVLDQRGALPESQVVPIVRNLVDALEYLHTTARFVHRDLKPENVMPNTALSTDPAEPLPRSACWKVCDFGVSCRVGGAHGGGAAGGVETLFFKVTCSRCPAEIAIPPRLKRRGLRDTEKIKCPKCGHVFTAQFEQPSASTDAVDISDVAADGAASPAAAPPEEAGPAEATMGGTAGYMAPELVELEKALNKGSPISAEQVACLSAPALDLFSLGKLTHYALTGVHPNSSFQFERLEKAAKGLVRRPSFVRQASSSGASPKNLQRRKDLSVPAQALLAALTAAAPAERPTAGSMVVRNWLSLMETAPELLPAQVLK